MTDSDREELKKAYKAWSAAKAVICQALWEFDIATHEDIDKYAVSILARLANHKPPILIDMDEATP